MSADVLADDKSTRTRRLWIGMGIIAVLAVALVVQSPPPADDTLAQPLTRPGAARDTSGSRGHAMPAKEDRQKAVLTQLADSLAQPARRGEFPPLESSGELAWGPRAPGAPSPSSAPAVAAEPAVPQAPEAPFQWVGRWDPVTPASGAASDAAPMAILSNDIRTWVVKRGDIVSLDWKIEHIDADRIELLYLPTSTRRSLSLNTP